MSIRCTSKAIILKGDRILLNRCKHENGKVFYDLPGGGQNTYESLEDAVVREVKEETGYTVRVIRFAALVEEIYTDQALRKRFPEYTHRMFHVFLAELLDVERVSASEKDFEMEEIVWVPLDEVEHLPEMCPCGLKENLLKLLSTDKPLYLGTQYMSN